MKNTTSNSRANLPENAQRTRVSIPKIFSKKALFAFAAFAGAAVTGVADDYTWGGGSGNWTGGNWIVNSTGGQTWLDDNAVFFTGSSGGTVTVDSAISQTGITVTGGANWTLAGGNIGGAGTLTMNGTGTLTLTGTTANTYTGGTIINGGTLSLGTGGTGSHTSNVDALGEGLVTINSGGTLKLWIKNNETFDIANAISIDGGTLRGEDGVYNINGGVTIGDNGATFYARYSGKNLIFNNVVSGTGAITIAAGGGSIIFNAENTYEGGTTFAGGLLVLAASNALGTGDVLLTGGDIVMGNGVTIDNNLTLGEVGDGTIPYSAQYEGSLKISDADSSATWSGDITINKLRAGGGHFWTHATSELHITGSITSSVEVVHRNGTLVLYGGGDYTQFTLSEGMLKLGADNGLATNATLNVGTAGAASFDMQGYDQTLAGLNWYRTGTLTGTGSTLTVNAIADTTFGNSTTGTATIDLSGLGKFILNGGSDYNFTVGSNANLTGNSTTTSSTSIVYLAQDSKITAGKITVGTNAGNSTGSMTITTLYLGANTEFRTNELMVGNTVKNSGTIALADTLTSGEFKLSGVADGTGTKVTLGYVTDTSGYSAMKPTGVLDLSKVTTDALISELIIAQKTPTSANSSAYSVTGTLHMGAGILKAEKITLADVGGGTGTVTATVELSAGGTIATKEITGGLSGGTGAITRDFKWNDGTIQNYDSASDLTISDAVAITVADTGKHAFDISTGRTGTVDATIADATTGGTINKTGAGTLVLNAANTYTGKTTIEAGTLQLGAAGSIAGSSEISVKTGAFLDVSAQSNFTIVGGQILSGTGTITGNVTIADGGTLAPGNSPGTLNVTGGVTLAAGAELIIAVEGAGAGEYSTLNLTGEILITSGAQLFFDIAAGALEENDVLTLLIAGSISTSGGFDNFDITATNGYELTHIGGSSFQVTAIPEPSTYALMGAAVMVGLVALRRRRKI